MSQARHAAMVPAPVYLLYTLFLSGDDFCLMEEKQPVATRFLAN